VRAIVGIGNPGKKYKLNRHNIGFLTLDYFAQSYKCEFSPSKYDYEYLEGDFGFNRYLLVKPTTYVNNSGIAVLQLIENYGIDPTDILIIVDDINLNKFDFRLKKSGSDGGHNGLASIIYHLNRNDFPRLRIGIGNDFEEGSLSHYVLSNFYEDEMITLKKLYPVFSDIIKSFIIGGYKSALAVYSRLKQEIKNNLSLN
jgi:PTH1 family peptidyl-tRNA hydrolase